VVPILVKNLSSAVSPVCDKKAALGIHRKRMWIPELPVLLTRLTPLHNVVAAAVEFDYTVVVSGSMTVNHKYAPIWSHKHVGWLVERIFPVTGHTCCTQTHEQLTHWAKFMDLMPFISRPSSISDPDVTFRIYVQPMRPNDHPRTEASYQLSVRRKKHYWIPVLLLHTGTLVRSTPLTYPDIHTVRSHVYRACRTPGPTLLQLSPNAVNGAVRIRCMILSQYGTGQGGQ
jgi:hypothetical protein